MNKTQLLSILVGILVIMNITAISFLLFKGQKGPMGPRMGNAAAADAFIKDEFGFDDTQMINFSKSKMKHQESIKPAEEELRKVSKAYYHLKPIDSSRDSLLNLIAQSSRNIYTINMEHLDEVRAICKNDQMENLEQFIDQLFNDDNAHKGPRPKRGMKMGPPPHRDKH